MQASAVPDALQAYAGRIVDVDSHEMMPAQIWTDMFGEVARPIADIIKAQPPRPNQAMWCCSLPPAPASINSATTSTVGRFSKTQCGRSHKIFVVNIPSNHLRRSTVVQ